jgi:hypothetical protein
MEIDEDPSGADEHTQGRCPMAVSDHHLVAEVQNRDSLMQ